MHGSLRPVNPAHGRFILLKGSVRATDLIVVLNWYEELKERMAR